MLVEEALLFLDTALQQKLLNNLQELVLRQAWAGQTYPEMAENIGYNANYIKDVGAKLWKLFSNIFNEKVTKSNFRSVFRRHYFAYQHLGQAESPLSKFKEHNVSIPVEQEDRRQEIGDRRQEIGDRRKENNIFVSRWSENQSFSYGETEKIISMGVAPRNKACFLLPPVLNIKLSPVSCLLSPTSCLLSPVSSY